MVGFKCLVLLCLVGIALAGTAGNDPNCKRESGDILLDSIPGITITVLGKASRTYPGYRITCVKCTSLLDGVQEILGLNVLNGGVNCNNVVLQLNINSILGSCKVYGKKLEDGETAAC